MAPSSAADLSARTAVVTGGMSGIGAACADRLAEAGATVVRWDLHPSADIQCDVSDAQAVEEAMRETSHTFGRPTIAVASAGTGSSFRIADLDPSEWDRIFGVNVRGTALLLQALAGSVRDLANSAGVSSGGSFVAVSSVNSVLPDRGMSAYGASKAAVNQLVRVAARELGGLGVRVNAIAPGPTDTPMLSALLSKPAYRQELEQRTALDGIATPQIIAEAAFGLLMMQWVTGQVLLVDGGLSLHTGRGEQW